jgi:hypothetical protein
MRSVRLLSPVMAFTCLILGMFAIIVGSGPSALAGITAKPCNSCNCNPAKTGCPGAGCTCSCVSQHGADICT